MKDIKLIVAGSRDLADYTLVHTRLHYLLHDIDHKRITIISGTARGVDRLGERFAAQYDMTLLKMPANWDKFGKSAGYRRNEEMAKRANACVIFWDGKSKGTKHMIDLAKRYNLHLRVYDANNQLMDT